MRLQQVAVFLLVLGVAFILGSLLWVQWMPPSVVYNEEQAHAYQEAATKFHKLAFDKEGPQGEAAKQAEAVYAQSRAQLDQAQQRYEATPKYLRWIGIACCGIGTICLLVQYSFQQ